MPLSAAPLPSCKRPLGAGASKSPKTIIISYLDLVKRLEAYLGAGGLPFEAEGIRASGR